MNKEKRFPILDDFLPLTNDLFAIFDKMGKASYLSPSWETTLGFTLAEIRDQNIVAFLNPEVHEQTTTFAFSFERHCRSKNGSYRWLSCRIHRDAESGLLAIAKDVTQSRKKDEYVTGVLKELQNFKYAVDQAMIVTLTDPEGNIFYANEMFTKLTGHVLDEILGENHRIFNSGYHPREFFETLWNTISAGKVWRGEVRDRRKDGSYIWLDTTIVPFMTKNKKPYQYMSIRKDITQKKELEENLLDERARREYSGRLAAVGEMASGISHEINNPLTGILTKAQLLRMCFEKNSVTVDRTVSTLRDIEKLCHRMTRIIRGLKALSRYEDQDPLVTEPLKGIVEDAVGLARPKFCEGGVRLEILPISERIVIPCRGVQISQVIFNLLSNAFDAVENLKNKWVRLEVSETSDTVLIHVVDSGPGVPEKYRARLFEPFFTTKPVHKGTGLGLSISNSIIHGHHGALELDTTRDNTTFVVRLPKIQTDEEGP